MKEVRKKSADAAMNQMLVKAYRQQVDLTWDRAEAMQPQCGFGRLAICCTDCFEGPCRVNPFAAEAQRTTCGRDQAALVGNYFLQKAADGATALVQLADSFGGDVDKSVWQTVARSDDAMFAADYDNRLMGLGKASMSALAAIAKAKESVYGSALPDVSAVNMGALKGDTANIVLHGHVPPKIVKALATAAAASPVPVQIAAICGNEISGPLNIPVLTNYDSQEAPLLTGAIDLLVTGGQCVMPAVVALAGKMAVPVMAATDIKQADEAIASAVAAFKRRTGKKADIPDVQEELYGGYTAANSTALLDSLAKAYGCGSIRGLAYFGGCGNLAITQDAELVKTAAGLINRGYVVVTAGCVGTALAKAGMCRPDYAGAAKAALGDGVPPVLYLGSCHDAGEFVAIARAASAAGVPVVAVLPELTHNKTLATAVGFASLGIATFVGMGEASLPGGILGGKLRSLAEFAELPQALAEVAAAK